MTSMSFDNSVLQGADFPPPGAYFYQVTQKNAETGDDEKVTKEYNFGAQRYQRALDERAVYATDTRKVHDQRIVTHNDKVAARALQAQHQAGLNYWQAYRNVSVAQNKAAQVSQANAQLGRTDVSSILLDSRLGGGHLSNSLKQAVCAAPDQAEFAYTKVLA